MRLVYTTFLIVAMSAIRLWAQDSCTSNTISLSVMSKPMVSISGATTICSGGSALLRATTTGGVGVCNLQWQSSEDGGANYQDILGEITKTLSIKTLSKTTYYRALYNCNGTGCDSKPSDPAIVTVVDKPLVSILANQLFICQNTPLAITASAFGGSGVPTYQWQLSPNGSTWTDITGETHSVYTNNNLSNSTYFRVVVTEQGDGCIVISTPVQISVDGCSGAIGDYVWLDCNKDGIQGADEKGLAGVTVILTGTTNAGKPVSLTTVSNASGFYLFSNLQAGTYTLNFGFPPNISGLVFTAKNAGNPILDSNVDASGKTDAIVLKSGETRTDIDAGYSESQGPSFLSIPKNITVDCDAIPVAPNISATDIFGATAIVNAIETKSSGLPNCSHAYTLTRKWTAKDNCNNVTTATQVITVQDTTAPVFTFVPADVTISCGQPIPNGADIKAQDNCDNHVDILQSDRIDRDNRVGCSNRVIHRIWTATDSCGNTSQAKQTITVKDIEAPVFVSVPQNLTVQCNKVPPLGAIITVKDNCDANPMITALPDKITFGACAYSYSIARVWTATDGCGNASNFTQTITVQDTIKPIILRTPSDITVDISKGETIPPAPVLNQDIIATDNCDVNPILQFTPTPKVSIGNCISKFQRTWRAIDNCGNTSTTTQNITILEAQPAATVSINIPETCAGNDGQVSLTPINFVYRWSDGGTGATRNNLTSGIYSVTVVSSATCTATQQITVTKLCLPCTAPILSATKRDISCGQTGDGTATVSISNGNVSDYKFIWTPTFSTMNTAKNLTKGTYSVRVEKLTDANCFATTQITIGNITDVIIADAAIVNAGCGITTGSATFNTNNDAGYTFKWSDGNTQSTRNNLAVGNFAVTVSHPAQCDIIKQVQIISTGEKPVVTVTTNKSENCTDKNGTVEFSPANLVYHWNDGIIGALRTNLSAGDYTVSVYNSPTCFIEQKITVGRACGTCVSPIVSVLTTDQTCTRNNDGKAAVSVSNGNIADYKFIWSPNVSSTISATNLVVGDYSVRVEKLSDPTCFSTKIFKINPAIDVVIDKPTIVNANCNTNGSITFNDDLNYKFVWNDNDTNRVHTNLLAGNYSVTVSRAGQCAVTKSFVITKICIPPTDSCKTPIASLTKIDQSCVTGTNGKATVNINNGSVSDYTFTWTPNVSVINSANNLPVGSYSVKIVKNNSTLICDTTINFTIDAANKLLVDAPIVKPADCTSPTGSIDYTNPANNGLKFRWNDLDTNRLRLKLSPGVYVVTISDPKSNRCPFTDSITVPNNNPLHTTSEIRSQPTCGKPNGYVKLTTTGGSGKYVYSWGEGDSRYVLPAGTTTVTTTDLQTGCKTTVTFNLINQNIEAVLVLDTITNLTCNGSADGRVNYLVTPGHGFVYPINIEIHDNQNRIVTNGALQAGKYVFQVKDSTGCVAVERNFTVTQPDIITATFTKRSVTCDALGSVSLKVSGGNAPYRYLWSDAGGNTTDNATRSNLQPGTYSVTVLDAGSCLISVKNIGILDSCPCRLPVIDSIASTSATCGASNGAGKIFLKNTLNINKYQFDWTPAIGNANSLGNERTSVSGGVYSVIISQRSNPSCFINANIGIGSLQGPKNINVVTTPATCEAANGTATLSPLPADSLTYTWLLDNSNAVSRNDLKTGFYQVLVSKNNLQDCPTLINVRVESQNTLTASVDITKKATCGLSNGVAVINAGGGSGNYQLRITNYELRIDSTIQPIPNTQYLIPNLAGGVYSVTVADQTTKCTTVVTFTMPNEVTGQTTIELADSVIYTHCVGTSDAQVQFKIVSPQPSAISYQLLDGATGKIIGDSSRLITQSSLLITNLGVGRYCLIVKDANKCITASKCFEVKAPTPLVAVATKVNRTCDAKGIINIAVTGGTGNYNYQWSDNPIILTASRSDLNIGTYRATVTDANGCKDTMTNVTIKDDCKPVICDLKGRSVVTNKTCDVQGSIVVNVTGGKAPFNFDWLDLPGANNPQNRFDISDGLYKLIITDSTGCRDTMSSILIANDCNGSNGCAKPIVSSVSTVDARCNAASGSISLSVDSLSVEALTLRITNNGLPITNNVLRITNNIYRITNLIGGAYIVKIMRGTDTTCFTQKTIIIKNSDAVVGTGLTPVLTAATCASSNGSADFGNATGLSFTWSDGKTGSKRTDLAKGSYLVTVSDVTKTLCDQLIAVEIPATNNTLSVTTIVNKQPSCGRNDGQATVNVGGGLGTYQLRIKNSELRMDSSFTFNSQLSTFNYLSAGNFTITVTDAVSGCTSTNYFTLTNARNSSAIINLASNIINTSCAGKTDARITFNVTYSENFAQPAKVEIKDANGIVVAVGLASAQQQFGAGKYTIQISDATGCLISASNFEVRSPTVITADVQTQSQKCTQLGSISLSVSGGTGNYKYSITNYELRITNDSLINLRTGRYSVTITDASSCQIVIDSIKIANDSLNCSPTPPTPCPTIFYGQTNYTTACGEKAMVCTKLNQIDTLNYKIYDNGVLYKNGFTQCGADTSVSYTYFTLVQKNPNGPWTLNEWVVNGQLHQGTFSSIQSIVDSMNVWDATSNWLFNASTYSIYSVNNARSYNKMLWSKNGLPIAELNTTVYEQYRRYGIKLDTGTHTLYITNSTQNCTDTTIIRITGQNCIAVKPPTCGKLVEGSVDGRISVQTPCGVNANVCTNLTGADTLSYKVYDNGNLYAAGFTKCRADTSVNYNYFTLVLSSANGPWTLNEWLVNGQLHKGVFNSIQALVDSMNVWDAPNKWQLDAKSFTIYSSNNKNICNNMFWSKNSKPIAQLMSSYYEEYRQVGIKLNVGVHQIIFENPTQHCRDTAQVTVKCFPFIGGTTRVEAKEKENRDSVLIKISRDSVRIGGGGRLKAVNDHAIAYQYQTVQIEPMLNDSLYGEKAIIVLVEPPTYGRAVLNQARGIVAYTPQENPCEKRDSFRYALVTANARDTAWITIEVVCDDLIVFTGFSPNGDGINDFFVIKGLENYKNNRLMVYNRFGNLVFETKNYQNDWAGTYNNQNLPDGTYFYIIDLGNGDQKSGYVQIQR